MTFKVGDRVRRVNCMNTLAVPVGSTGTVVEILSDMLRNANVCVYWDHCTASDYVQGKGNYPEYLELVLPVNAKKSLAADVDLLEQQLDDAIRMRDLYHADLKISGANNKNLRVQIKNLIAERDRFISTSRQQELEQLLENERRAHKATSYRASVDAKTVEHMRSEIVRLRKYINDNGNIIIKAIDILRS